MATSFPPTHAHIEFPALSAPVTQPRALARVLAMALAFGAAAVPAFVSGNKPQAWGLAVLSLCLALRFPMAGLCAVLGSGAFLLFTVVGVYDPALFGPPGIWDDDVLVRGCAWLTLFASVLSLLLMDVPTFHQAFRTEGRPVATWRSISGAFTAEEPSATPRS